CSGSVFEGAAQPSVFLRAFSGPTCSTLLYARLRSSSDIVIQSMPAVLTARAADIPDRQLNGIIGLMRRGKVARGGNAGSQLAPACCCLDSLLFGCLL